MNAAPASRASAGRTNAAPASRTLGPLPDWSLGAGFALATVVLTWPLAASLSEPIATRDDYLSNLWNFWWMHHALFELGTSPYFTEWLHHPLGVSLGRHTLSPLNSVPGGILATFVGLHTAYALLLLLHFWLSAWTCALLARELTGNRAAAALAGLIYSFSPFHYYYLAQINAATLEWLPLAMLFLLRSYRTGELRFMLAFAATAGLLALSASYYLVYAAVFGAILFAAGRLAEPPIPWTLGARRVVAAGGLALVSVALCAWPLLADVLASDGAPPKGAGASQLDLLATRSLDLLGYPWIGPPDRILMSWPSMLGYSAIGLLAAGARAALRERFWWLVGAAFLLLGLGPSLHVGGSDTGIPLPAAWLADVPILGMLRKADRSFAVLQLVFALLCSFAWCGFAARLERNSARMLWGAIVLLIAIETTCVPLQAQRLHCSPVYSEIARDSSIEAIVELPAHPAAHGANARHGFCQSIHGKKIAQGYVTSLALDGRHVAQARSWRDGMRALGRGRAEALEEQLAAADVDALVLHKLVDNALRPAQPSGELSWSPFVLLRHRLLPIRQRGGLELEPVPAALQAERMRALQALFGTPAWEDDRVAVFRRRKQPQ